VWRKGGGGILTQGFPPQNCLHLVRISAQGEVGTELLGIHGGSEPPSSHPFKRFSTHPPISPPPAMRFIFGSCRMKHAELCVPINSPHSLPPRLPRCPCPPLHQFLSSAVAEEDRAPGPGPRPSAHRLPCPRPAAARGLPGTISAPRVPMGR